MSLRRGTVAATVCIGIGLSAACSAVLGITEFTPADGGAGDATMQDDVEQEGGSSGVNGQDGSNDSSSGAGCSSSAIHGGLAVLGCPCPSSQAGQLACNGNASSQPLVCANGLWSGRPQCDAGNCDTTGAAASQGTCAPIDPLCADASPGQPICTGATTLVQCGPDLVSHMAGAPCTDMACVNGVCTGVCAPGMTQCSGNGVQTCASDGGWMATSACAEFCDAGACGFYPSCQGGGEGAGSNCGPGADGGAGTNDCCASLEVPPVPSGSFFYRSYDGVSAGDTSQAYPAAISGFRLDAYEVTVGRFRKFVEATVSASWAPIAPGAGKHAHLNGGSGLVSVGVDAGGFETGWSGSWDSNIATSQATWNTNLACPGDPTWTAAAGANEQRPINCITWYEAYAFCIWDGAFLPSEAEWNYAASGGTDQRVYPWSTPASSATINCTYANYLFAGEGGNMACSATGATTVGNDSPKGDGAFGQSDLGGNVWEWALDSYATYVTPCTDCTNLTSTGSKVTRGGSYEVIAPAVLASYRGQDPPGTRDSSVGVRCARAP